MATDEQMAVALLALGAVAIYAMNNSTESVSPARRKENQQNALRATIHTWCANAKTYVSKIAVRSMSRGGDENGVPDRTDLRQLEQLRVNALGYDGQAEKLKIPQDAPSRKALGAIRRQIATLYNREKTVQPMTVQNITVVDATQTHNETRTQQNLVQRQTLVEGDKIINLQHNDGKAQARENAVSMDVDQQDNTKPCLKPTQPSGLPETIQADRQQAANIPTGADVMAAKTVGPKDRPRDGDDTARKLVDQGRTNPKGLHAGTANTGGEATELTDNPRKKRKVVTVSASDNVPPPEANTITFQQSEPATVPLTVAPASLVPPMPAGQPAWIDASQVHTAVTVPKRIPPPQPLLQSIDDPQARTDGRVDPALPSRAVTVVKPKTDLSLVPVELTPRVDNIFVQWRTNLDDEAGDAQDDHWEYCNKKFEATYQAVLSAQQQYLTAKGPPRKVSVSKINKFRLSALSLMTDLLHPGQGDPYQIPDRNYFKIAHRALIKIGYSAERGLQEYPDLSPQNTFFRWWRLTDQAREQQDSFLQGVKREDMGGRTYQTIQKYLAEQYYFGQAAEEEPDVRIRATKRPKANPDARDVDR